MSDEKFNVQQKQLTSYKQLSDELMQANVNLRTNILLLQEMVEKEVSAKNALQVELDALKNVPQCEAA